MSNLESNSKDLLVSLSKGIVGSIPYIGSIVSEAIGTLIPNQRLDRVVEFLTKLELEVTSLDLQMRRFRSSMQTPEGLDLIEEGLIQASRAVTLERKERLARLVGRSLTAEQLNYAESRKLLNIYRELTDPELIWLIYYGNPSTLGCNDITEKNPDIFRPASQEIGAPQEERDRGAIQESYKNTLLRLGLIREKERFTHLTQLGRLMLRYIVDIEPS